MPVAAVVGPRPTVAVRMGMWVVLVGCCGWGAGRGRVVVLVLVVVRGTPGGAREEACSGPETGAFVRLRAMMPVTTSLMKVSRPVESRSTHGPGLAGPEGRPSS